MEMPVDVAGHVIPGSGLIKEQSVLPSHCQEASQAPKAFLLLLLSCPAKHSQVVARSPCRLQVKGSTDFWGAVKSC